MGNKRTNTVLLLPILATLLHSYLTHGLELKDYQTLLFSNPSQNLEFTRLTIHNETGSVYIGGADRLYRLGADFTRQETVNTLVACDEEICPLNYNKILLVDYGGNMLVTCGSESFSASDPAKKPGTCQTRALDSIKDPMRDDDTPVVPPGKLTAEAILAPGPLNGGVNSLYVAATFDETRYQSYQIYPVTRRLYSASTDTDIIFSVEPDAEIALNRANYPDVPFIINYIYTFVREFSGTSPSDYTYFVTTQRQDFISREDRNYVSKINRMCQTVASGFRSYAEITLDCQGSDSSNKYNLIQAAYVGPAGADLASSMGLSTGDDVLYGVFAKNEGVDGDTPSSQSALCVYKLEDIEERFIDGIFGCLNDGDKFELRYLQSTECRGLGTITREQAEGQQCSAINWALADNFTPFASTAVIEWSDVVPSSEFPSSIVTATHKNHTVAFVGTSEGNLVKVHIESMTKGREYERFMLDSSPVLRDNAVEESQEMVTLMTQQKLLKLHVQNCAAYTTCDECIGGNAGEDGDPYCGWCTLEKRCSIHDDCPMADTSTRWLPYNSAQCVGISNVAPYASQPITTGARKITLTVEQLPDLLTGTNNNYQCVFDDDEGSPAMKNGNQLMCITPLPGSRPVIPNGSDHVTMKLNVFSTETKVMFVTTDYDFYECDTHKMCVACTNSSWACDWCIYSNKCTHDNGTCSSDTRDSIIGGVNNPNSGAEDGFEFCPQLAPQDGNALVSVGVRREIKANVENLPPEKVTSYECRLNVEGQEQTVSATRSGDRITCQPNSYTFNQDVHTLDVRLTVVWNGDRKFDDVHGFDVTLYKCDVERPDCSRCLSNLTTMPELECGWCQSAGVCSVEDSPGCSGGWISPSTGTNCPSPVLTGVSPPTGPQEGGTIIAISGTDLGKKFEDVLLVTIGGDVCAVEGLEGHYIAGSSVSCLTVPGGIDEEAQLAVRVMGADGNPQDSTGNAVFTYRDPSISSFTPTEGPAAGGTEVQIEGMYLDAGYEITAMIGMECTVDKNSITETSATCRTSGGNANDQNKVVMSFDGATRESENEFTFKPNPEVDDVQPRSSIQSGGRDVTVTGKRLDLGQNPMMIVYSGDKNFTATCEHITSSNGTLMTCKTPRADVTYQELQTSSNRKKRAADPPSKLQFGFIVGDVQDLLEWSTKNNATLDYFPDPVYDSFKADPDVYNGSILILTGQNLDFASSEGDVYVWIGPAEAQVQSLDESSLTCKIPATNPGAGDFRDNNTDQGLPIVFVVHGNLEFNIGRLRYPTAELPLAILIIASVCGLLVLLLIIAGLVLRSRINSHKEETGKLLVEMQNLETSIADDIRSAFAQLQTDVTDLTSDLEGTGMPFVSHRQYAMSMFFHGLDIQPVTFDQENPDETLERAMLEFSKLLGNKTFLMAFIQTLDDDKKIPQKDKQNIASLLTVLMILEDKLPYLTDVMITLMSRHVEDVVNEEKPRQLFQRTETIVEKLLTNWIALSLYDFLKDHTAYPLFLLYRAIKCQSEKGPIDVITGKSHFSLSDENVLNTDVEFEELVIVNDEDGEKKEVKCLDVDTVSQVKEKILDSIYRNRPYSARQNAQQVDLEWRHGQSGHLVLQDVDVSSHADPGWKKINTLSHFSVPDCSRMALVVKQTLPNVVVADTAPGATNYPHLDDEKHSLLQKPLYNMVDYQVEDGVQLWHLQEEGVQLYHLVKEQEGLPDDLPKKKGKNKQPITVGKKHIREINFPRLLSTKGTVQEYVDQMFASILNTQDVPLGIKYIFDFFDGQARRYDVMDKDILHKWKSNTLPLRFWQGIITNPNYIFDVRQSHCVEASLRVVSQAFFDAFSRSDHKLGKNAPFNKLLYNREMPKYREMVDTYYSSVSQMEKVTKSALDGELKNICQKFTGLFSRLSTLTKLYHMMRRYKTQVEDAMEDDEECQKGHFAEKLEEVTTILEEDGNDYVLS